MDNTGRIGVALLGLGSYSTSQLGPALMQSKNCYLAGIITNTRIKASMWKRKYSIADENIYEYSNFDHIVDNPDIGIIYVTTPNAMHREFVIRAARAGKHVICEKPLGISSMQCQEMIAECRANNVKLAVGYRMQCDPYQLYLRALNLKQSEKIKSIAGSLAFPLNNSSDWRWKQSISGGGALMDIGIYGIQTSCFIYDKQPIEVIAKIKPNQLGEAFETEESIWFKLFFENGLTASFNASYLDNQNSLEVTTKNRVISVDRAFSLNGQTITGTEQPIKFAPVNQVALQIDDFAKSIIHNLEVKISGEIGLRDLKIIEALYESSKTNVITPVDYN